VKNEKIPWKHFEENLWIVKPAYSNQGRGILVSSKIQEIKDYLSGWKDSSQFIIQKYLERPFLYKKRKFDIRILSVVTQEGELFVYQTGYMRTSSYLYTLEDQKNKFIHLTNNCLQVLDQQYSAFEEGNTLPLSQMYAEI
jgi:hypothetical protein